MKHFALGKTILSALTIGALCCTTAGCSSVSTGSSQSSAPAISVVKVPDTDVKVEHTKALTAHAKEGAAAQWSTSYQIFGEHPKYNAEISKIATAMAREARTGGGKEITLKSSIPYAYGKQICQRLTIETKGQNPQGNKGASQDTQASSPSASTTDSGQYRGKTLCTYADKDELVSSLDLFSKEKLQDLTRKVAKALEGASKLQIKPAAQSPGSPASTSSKPDDSAKKSDAPVTTSGKATPGASADPSSAPSSTSSSSPQSTESQSKNGTTTSSSESAKPQAADSLPAMPELFDDVIVEEGGNVVVVLSPGMISSEKDGPVAVKLSNKEVSALLSEVGKSYLKAASEKTKFSGFKTDPKAEGQLKAIEIDKLIDCTVEKCVALTYDDGPGPNTPKLLDILKEEGVSATFMVIGPSAKSMPQILQREIAEGHEIGCHTWTHPPLSRIPAEKIDKEINDTVAQIEKAVPGYKVTFTRPPYGDGAFGKGNAKVIGELKKLNQGIAMWDVDTLDWQHRDPAKVKENIRKQVKSGSIILMHDIHNASIEAARDYIKYLREQGYHFVTFSQLYGGKVEPGKRYFDLKDVQ